MDYFSSVKDIMELFKSLFFRESKNVNTCSLVFVGISILLKILVRIIKSGTTSGFGLVEEMTGVVN